jgi:farnesyl diphosphate synthase
LVSDDIKDSSAISRGLPSWYQKPEVGLITICDPLMLEAPIYCLLKTHFRGESYYVDLVELFHEITFQTGMGQLTDFITAPEDQVDLSKFSLTKYVFFFYCSVFVC